MNNINLKKNSFTLVEVLVSMAVFSILMLALIGFFNSAQKVFSESTRKAEMYENARLAMDFITRDLQSIYYVSGKTPFWHGAYDGGSSWGNFRHNEILAFTAKPSTLHGSDNKSKICEIKYQKAYANTHSDSLDGCLRRSCTDDSDGTKWNFYGNNTVSLDTSSDAFTANSSSSSDYYTIIPYVVECKFECIKPDGTSLNKDTDAVNPSPMSCLPYSIDVTLTLMDKASWQKWCSLSPDANGNGKEDPTTTTKGDTESQVAFDFRKKNQRTFTKTIFIGDRGQYN